MPGMDNVTYTDRGFEVEVLADSTSADNPNTTSRLTTMRWRYPRFIHSECMTHRQFSRNAASSRAIPTHKLREQVLKDPAMPVHWGRAQKGMQAFAELGSYEKVLAEAEWKKARDEAVASHERMERLGLAKQVANRILEPWMWMESIWTATEEGWDNLLFLRDHPDAQPEFQHLAKLIREAYENSTPQALSAGDWHVPYFDVDQDLELVGPTWEKVAKVCAARCARVSYLTHDGKRDVQKDLDLFARLTDRGDQPRHLSPLEHVAMHQPGSKSCGNLRRGWLQLRREYERPVPKAVQKEG